MENSCCQALNWYQPIATTIGLCLQGGIDRVIPGLKMKRPAAATDVAAGAVGDEQFAKTLPYIPGDGFAPQIDDVRPDR